MSLDPNGQLIQPEESKYVHRPVWGLPTSLITPEGKSIPVIALMQRQAGLNREKRREMQAGVRVHGPAIARLARRVPKSDWSVLTYYLNPGERFDSFWYVVKRLLDPQGRLGSRAYAVAVDVQLLSAYEPQWLRLQLDEAQLTAACPEWPQIRRTIESSCEFEKERAPLGMFMLWPRLLAELKRWDELEAGRRLKVGHAVFALSSIGWTDWFINQALIHCPQIEPELGSLRRSRSNDQEPADESPMQPRDAQRADDKEQENSLNLMAGVGCDRPISQDPWADALQRLDAVTTALKERPSRDAVAELSRVALDFEQLAATLPEPQASAIERFEERRRDLIAYLEDLATRPDFAWLDAAVVSQIDARWRLAFAERSDPRQIEELGDDAAAAIVRSEDAADACLRAAEVVKTCQQAVQTVELALSTAKGFGEQVSARRRYTDAQKQELDAKATQFSTQERLIDAASPFAEPFDHSTDYVAKLNGSESAVIVDDRRSTLVHVEPETAPQPVPHVAGDSHGVATVQPAPLERQESAGAMEAADEDVIEDHQHEQLATSAPAQLASSQSSLHAVSDASADEYSDAAGEVCRPIWHLLAAGQTALAFHVARWIEEAHPGTKVPPPDLLAAAALAEGLILPDGALQAAVGNRLENLVAADYAADTPPAWHAAVNLLLVAATLRPMVLAPSTGAATVAGYLHQDGNYPAFYALVQKLRGLSAKLVGFRIEPAVLRQARGEAAIRADLQSLQRTAEDWLRIQAPAYTIKFAAATGVWKHWLRPGGPIEALVAPVVHNRIADAGRVREQLSAMSDSDHVTRLIHSTDRRELKRRRGEEIHAGALEHLLRLVDEAMNLPRLWLSLVELLGGRGDRLRELLDQVHAALHGSRAAVELELKREPAHDPWRLIVGGQRQALQAMRGLISLFDATSRLGESEPQPIELLGRPLLCVPELPVSENWTVETDAPSALAAVRRLKFEPLLPEAALRQRADRGDYLGAEMMISTGLVEFDVAHLRSERERWKQALLKEMNECQRSVEVGSAYGYLPDAERGQIESQLARWEAQLEDVRRFDLAMAEVKALRGRVEKAREAHKQAVRETLQHITPTESSRPTVAEVEQALEEGDIATANELVHWLQQGKPAPNELDEEAREGFDDFFPASMRAIESWLEEHKRETVETALRLGQSIPGLNVKQVDGAQRMQAARMFADWSDMNSRQEGERVRLERLLTGLGLTVKELRRTEKVSGREFWSLDALPVEDRHICPVPMYGSAAGGRYRVFCIWGRPSEDDLLQWVGDVSDTRPALLLYFGRMTERKWRDLSRTAKANRRSLLMLDETLLVYLCCTAGSRLRTWFDVAMPFSYSLPYDATAGVVPPEMFYGRGIELDAVRGLNGRCFIYGGRQLGKTALLKRAEQSFHAPSRGHYARWIDLRAEGIGVSLAASEIWLTLHEKLRELEIVDPKLARPAPGKKQGAESVVRAIRFFLAGNSDRRLLLLLDEADRFFEQDGRNDFEETRKLKQMMDDTQRRFKVVFAGLHNVLRMTERPNHPLAHFGEPIEIGPLREGEEVREAAGLIRQPMAAAGFAFESKGLIIRILAQTNYYPSLIQLYCSHLLRHMLELVAGRQRTGGPRYVVTDRDIEQVYSSDALRDEIRAKFRLTLQLDPRYEVLAYAMALDLLRGRYTQSEGIPWQTIRQSGALNWWAEGFRDTSELDFRVLLDEMVGLGVLRKLPAGRYVLRNPNVLLLLGTQEEIETVLNKEREPAVEFESASFRPPLRRGAGLPARNVFTYQQLSQLLQHKNDITIVTGTEAAGISSVVADLEDYLGSATALVVLANDSNRQSFGNSLQNALINRPRDQVSVFVVPESVPWTEGWLQEAQARLKSLRSESKFASLVFVADPATLWRLVDDDRATEGGKLPWMSLLHWTDGFLRHWLEERQIQLEPEERRRLAGLTGLWPGLITELAGDRTELRALRERIGAMDQRWFADPDRAAPLRKRFGLDVAEPVVVIDVLAQLCKPNDAGVSEPVESSDLAAIAGSPQSRVDACLRWGDLLGLTRREGAGFWTVDPIVSKMLLNLNR